MRKPQKLYLLIIAIILAVLAAYITLVVKSFDSLKRLPILPVPTYLPILSTILPILSIIALPTLSRNFRTPLTLPSPSGSLRFNRPSFASILVLVILTVIVTFVPIDRQYTDSGAVGLQCGLDKGWQRMWSGRDLDGIRKIQDSLNCCGFRTMKDRAFPDVKPSTCSETFKRDHACLPALVDETKRVLWNGVLLGVLSLVVWLGGGIGVGMVGRAAVEGGIRDGMGRIEDGVRNGGPGLLPVSATRIEEGSDDDARDGETRGLLEGNANADGNGVDHSRRYLGEAEVWRS